MLKLDNKIYLDHKYSFQHKIDLVSLCVCLCVRLELLSLEFSACCCVNICSWIDRNLKVYIWINVSISVIVDVNIISLNEHNFHLEYLIY